MMLVLAVLVDGMMYLCLSRGLSRGRRRMMTLLVDICWWWWGVRNEHES